MLQRKCVTAFRRVHSWNVSVSASQLGELITDLLGQRERNERLAGRENAPPIDMKSDRSVATPTRLKDLPERFLTHTRDQLGPFGEPVFLDRK